jgi:hypothetical protein
MLTNISDDFYIDLDDLSLFETLSQNEELLFKNGKFRKLLPEHKAALLKYLAEDYKPEKKFILKTIDAKDANFKSSAPLKVVKMQEISPKSISSMITNRTPQVREETNFSKNCQKCDKLLMDVKKESPIQHCSSCQENHCYACSTEFKYTKMKVFNPELEGTYLCLECFGNRIERME